MPFFGQYASPVRFERLATTLLPWLAALTLALFSVGLIWALFIAPQDYQHGHAVRIMFIHVPAAMIALLCYCFMTVAAVIFLYRGHVVADIAAQAAAPLGLAFTFIALITGSIWGKPMWGTWWVWDARLTSTFVQFFIFLGVIALRRVVADPARGGRLIAIFTLCGAVNIPIIRYSVVWWNTLHQPPSLSLTQPSNLHPTLLWPLLIMIAAFACLLATLTLVGTLAELYRRRRNRLDLAEMSRSTAPADAHPLASRT